MPDAEVKLGLPPAGAQPILNAAFSRQFGEVAEAWLLPKLAGWTFDDTGNRRSLYDYPGGRLTEVTIDYDRGLFIFSWEATTGDRKAVFSPMCIPPFEDDDGFWSDWAAARLLLPEEQFLQFKTAVTVAWRQLASRLLSEISEGGGAIFARLNSPLNPILTELPADVWRAFDVKDWRRGVAVCAESGDRIFGVHVLRPQRAAPLSARDIEGVADAIAWANEERKGRGQAVMTIGESEAWGKEHSIPRDAIREARRLLDESQKRARGGAGRLG